MTWALRDNDMDIKKKVNSGLYAGTSEQNCFQAFVPVEYKRVLQSQCLFRLWCKIKVKSFLRAVGLARKVISSPFHFRILHPLWSVSSQLIRRE
jgi:hypothetical protein